MEFRVLKYFLAVARHENITKAANELHLTQPTLSRQLSELEAELGTELFLRGKRRTMLTEEGLYFKSRAEEIVRLTKLCRKAPCFSYGDIYPKGHAVRHVHRICVSNGRWTIINICRRINLKGGDYK